MRNPNGQSAAGRAARYRVAILFAPVFNPRRPARDAVTSLPQRTGHWPSVFRLMNSPEGTNHRLQHTNVPFDCEARSGWHVL
jgi:hypothetical protein